MADISMCDGEDCSKKSTCYRYLAKPNPYRQSYISPDPRGETCEAYWKVESNSQLKRMDALNKDVTL